MNYSLLIQFDIKQLTQLFLSVFSDSEGADEGKSVAELAERVMTQTAKQDLLVCVAEQDEQIKGVILFTRMQTQPSHVAYLLSPVAIATELQGKGVGQGLINFGLQQLKAQGAQLAFTYGDPAFYSKVGFERIDHQRILAPQTLSYPHGWLGQSLVDEDIQSMTMTTTTVSAFDDPQVW